MVLRKIWVNVEEFTLDNETNISVSSRVPKHTFDLLTVLHL